MAADAPAVFPGGNTKQANADETGDLDAGFKAAAHVIEQTYSTHVITHVCLETHGCVCEWEGDKLTAWVSTQAVHRRERRLRDRAEDSASNVRVITPVHGRRFRQQVRRPTRRV